MIEVEHQGHVALVSLGHGKVNALDIELLAELTSTLQQVESSGARAVVLTSSRPVFSAGVDLYRVLDGDDTYAFELITRLHETFRAWFATPLPVVAALNGSAIAGGCVLAACADFRLMTEGPFVIGVSELVVGVPFPAAAVEIVSFACAHHAGEVLLRGKLHSPAEATRVGLVHEVVPSHDLIQRATAVAGELAEHPGESTALAKSHLRLRSLRWMDERSKHDGEVARIWSSADTHSRISDAIARSIRSRSTGASPA